MWQQRGPEEANDWGGPEKHKGFQKSYRESEKRDRGESKVR
jgi:hypothetical protein